MEDKIYAIFSKQEFFLITTDKEEADDYWNELNLEDSTIPVPAKERFFCSIDKDCDLDYLRYEKQFAI